MMFPKLWDFLKGLLCNTDIQKTGQIQKKKNCMVKKNGLIYIKFFDIINNYIERKKKGDMDRPI